jgi:hypothetical protein
MNDLLSLSFAAFAALFTVWNAVYLARYLAYRRIAARAELTWLPSRPWFYNMCLAIGFFMVTLTALSVIRLLGDKGIAVTPRSPSAVSVTAQALMALYYVVVFPLSFRIRRGLYLTGIWTERSFVPYARIRSLNWLEKPNVVLILETEGGFLGGGYARLYVPGESYGQARRILAAHIEDRTLSTEKSILGLDDAESPAQERV